MTKIQQYIRNTKAAKRIYPLAVLLFCRIKFFFHIKIYRLKKINGVQIGTPGPDYIEAKKTGFLCNVIDQNSCGNVHGNNRRPDRT